MFDRMVNEIFLIAVLLSAPTYTLAQKASDAEDPNSRIKGPLITLHEDSFADTLLVLLQSLYYNNRTLVLESHTAATTVDGVDLMVEYDQRTLSLADVSLQKEYILIQDKNIFIRMDVPLLLANKTYTIKSAHDPNYTSKGYVTLTNDGMQFILMLDSTDMPYFVTAGWITEGNRTTEIHGQGIPLADEIQDKIQDLVLSQFQLVDVGTILDDVKSKLDYIFNRNELILCLSCETQYCVCYD